jgi:hypothetical protein
MYLRIGATAAARDKSSAAGRWESATKLSKEKEKQ